LVVSGHSADGNGRKLRRSASTALEALALAYEAKFIFESIRSPGSYSYEYESMPAFAADNEERRAERGPFYAALKRIEAHKDFFERAWKVQTRG
jgi:hypothetical protein